MKLEATMNWGKRKNSVSQKMNRLNPLISS